MVSAAYFFTSFPLSCYIFILPISPRLSQILSQTISSLSLPFILFPLDYSTINMEIGNIDFTCLFYFISLNLETNVNIYIHLLTSFLASFRFINCLYFTPLPPLCLDKFYANYFYHTRRSISISYFPLFFPLLTTVFILTIFPLPFMTKSLRTISSIGATQLIIFDASFHLTLLFRFATFID